MNIQEARKSELIELIDISGTTVSDPEYIVKIFNKVNLLKGINLAGVKFRFKQI